MAGILTDGVGAGPLPLTGNETLNMDTNLTQGQNPASGAYSPVQLVSGPSTFTSIVSGNTVTIPGIVRTEVVNGSSTVATLNVVLTPVFDGQRQAILPTSAATAVTFSSATLAAAITTTLLAASGSVLSTSTVTAGTSPAINAAPASLVAGTTVSFMFKNGAWYKE